MHLGFLKKVKHLLRVPRAEEGVANSKGIVVYGDVLSGKLGTPEALALDATRAAQRSAAERRGGGGGLRSAAQVPPRDRVR